jgi:hypothetical protein
MLPAAAAMQVVQDRANLGVLGRLASFKYAFASVMKVRGPGGCTVS